jgi:ABC-2 type transport system ATP-binding protein
LPVLPPPPTAAAREPSVVLNREGSSTLLGIEVERLTRVFESHKGLGRTLRAVRALDELSLAIQEGEVHGLLGPNGAGKTTLVKILSTVLLPTSGNARVLGRDVVREAKAVRSLIGISFGGERGLYMRLTGRQNMTYWAALHNLPDRLGRSRADSLLARFGLVNRADARVETYSRGMKQRLHLARALIAEPAVLFLDEPTAGMDPIATREFRELVHELKAEGRTILLTTHDMSEAEELCDRVTLIDHGRILAAESPRTLARWIANYERIDVDGAPPSVIDEIKAIVGVNRVTSNTDGSARIEMATDTAVPLVLRRLVALGITSIRTSHPSLEDVYVELIGKRGTHV